MLNNTQYMDEIIPYNAQNPEHKRIVDKFRKLWEDHRLYDKAAIEAEKNKGGMWAIIEFDLKLTDAQIWAVYDEFKEFVDCSFIFPTIVDRHDARVLSEINDLNYDKFYYKLDKQLENN